MRSHVNISQMENRAIAIAIAASERLSRRRSGNPPLNGALIEFSTQAHTHSSHPLSRRRDDGSPLRTHRSTRALVDWSSLQLHFHTGFLAESEANNADAEPHQQEG